MQTQFFFFMSCFIQSQPLHKAPPPHHHHQEMDCHAEGTWLSHLLHHLPFHTSSQFLAPLHFFCIHYWWVISLIFSAHKMLQCSLKEENPFENGVNCQNHPRYPSSPVPAISGFVLLAVVSQYFTETVSPAGLIPIGNLGVHAYFMLFLKVNLNKSFLSLQRNSFRRASCAKARVRELSWQALAVYLWECF